MKPGRVSRLERGESSGELATQVLRASEARSGSLEVELRPGEASWRCNGVGRQRVVGGARGRQACLDGGGQ
jgi:hypothetical protein